MADNAGRPIRSQDLRRSAQQNEERFKQTNAAIGETLSRTEMLSLALQAKRPRPPAGVRPGPQHTEYVKAEPGPTSGQVGPFTCSKRIRFEQKLYTEDIIGKGPLELIRPDGIWATRTENRVQTFEVRLQPARLLTYNEVLVPHIAGDISINLYGPSSTVKEKHLKESRLLRYKDKQSFNGRLKLQSRSDTTDSHGRWIHTCGGITLFESDWSQTGQAYGRITAKENAALSQVDVTLQPDTYSPSFTILKGGDEVQLPVSVSKGDVLELQCSGIPGDVTSSLLKVETRYTG